MKFPIHDRVKTKNNMFVKIIDKYWSIHMDEYVYLCQCTTTRRTFEFLERDIKEID